MVVPLRSFEVLVKSLGASNRYQQALQAVGFDADSPRDDYPVELWRQALEISREHVYPGVPADQAYREMGLRCVAGMAQTLLGKVVALSLANMSPEGFIRRMPTFAAFGRPGVTVDVWAEGDRRWRAKVVDPVGTPEFTAGVIEGALQRNKLPVEIRVEHQDPGGYELLFTW